MSDADLESANLLAANLQGAILVRTKLKSANLVTANLQNATLGVANLQGTDLAEANLQGVKNIDTAHFDENTILPDGTNWTPETDMVRFTDPGHPDFWDPCVELEEHPWYCESAAN